MTQPRDLTVELDALDSDARKWSAASDDIDLARTAAQNLSLDIAQFGWVADEHGVVTAYQAIQGKLAGLLGGAAQEFDNVAAELRATAESYGRTETTGVDRFNDLDKQSKGTLQEQPGSRGRING